MSKRDPDLLLDDMHCHATEAIAMCDDKSRQDLDTHRLLSLALVRLLEIIGKAAAQVPPEVREVHPDIAWAAIVGMRNRLIHGYPTVDHDIVWRIVQTDLPGLVAELQRAE